MERAPNARILPSHSHFISFSSHKMGRTRRYIDKMPPAARKIKDVVFEQKSTRRGLKFVPSTVLSTAKKPQATSATPPPPSSPPPSSTVSPRSESPKKRARYVSPESVNFEETGNNLWDDDMGPAGDNDSSPEPPSQEQLPPPPLPLPPPPFPQPEIIRAAIQAKQAKKSGNVSRPILPQILCVCLWPFRNRTHNQFFLMPLPIVILSSTGCCHLKLCQMDACVISARNSRLRCSDAPLASEGQSLARNAALVLTSITLSIKSRNGPTGTFRRPPSVTWDTRYIWAIMELHVLRFLVITSATPSNGIKTRTWFWWTRAEYGRTMCPGVTA